MKKILFVCMALLLVVVAFACTKVGDEAKWRIWLITDSGTITDRSFNQGTWEGVLAFADANDEVEAHYLRPDTVSDAGYKEAIEIVIEEKHANVVVTPGFLFEVAIYEEQTKHPDVYFILIDGEPHSDTGTYKTEENTINVLFKEEQSGFLAGYAAVQDGFSKLGFVGGQEVPAVVRFGIGYVAGAYYAANQLSRSIAFPASQYWYTGTFGQSPDHVQTVSSWYNTGTDIIFAAAGAVGLDVMSAAEHLTNKYVIGVDVDQSDQSPTVISSAVKQLAVAVQRILADLISDNWHGGVTLNYGANEDSVGLPTASASWRWRTFSVSQYVDIVNVLKVGTLVVPTSEALLATFLATHCGNPSIEDLIEVTESQAGH
ncbi:MAG: BMP family ABC transporter substrate-binding protein [Acholeplasmatales bacterium]|jgi:basic membrane protein A|nr:BMP family ABC transporter substrate-binding protein [Acholeplasmatales bacterium]